jgi:hypothetical protein
MAVTFGSVIDYVLKTLGRADVGEDRATIFTDISDILTVDFPATIAGYMIEGVTRIPVGGVPAAPDGVYDVPATMRGVSSILGVLDNIAINSPPEFSRWFPENTYTDPDSFFAVKPWLSEVGNMVTDTGKPTSALIYGNKITLRPVPDENGSPTWFGELVLTGSVTPDLSAANESTTFLDDRVVPVVRAAATVLYAVRSRRADVATLWGQILQTRKQELQNMMSTFPSNTQPGRDF